jgi:DNA-binding LytR/AlgR family response regulator
MEGGDKPLLLYRFGDAIADLDGLDGLQVHRGAWIAARAVAGAEREGRRWWLRLPDGTRLPVSERHLPAVRARGWLAR